MRVHTMSVSIPERMQGLPKAGIFPVPYIVAYDKLGAPQFTVNDGVKREKCVRRKLCPICGQRLTRELWFVGGPLSAFHEHGYYYDSAMHHECMTYALQVCPWLASRHYDAMPLDDRIDKLSKTMSGVFVDTTMMSQKPPAFVAVMAYGQSISSEEAGAHIRPLRPYHGVEFWTMGARLSTAAGLALVSGTRGLCKQYIDSAMRLVVGAK